jgi:hypothetical protein
MAPKALLIVPLLSLTMAYAGHKHSVKHEAVAPSATATSAIALGMDSMFVSIKQEFDQIPASPVVKNKAVPPVNGHFFKTLKEHQPFYSLERVNAKGVLVNEVVRLVDDMTVKKQNLSKEAWVKQTIKKHKEYAGMTKSEETGRYYLVWAAPVIEKDKKGKDALKYAVALKLDMWDCFHKFANNTQTPFLVRIGKLHLYSNKWKDSMEFKEEPLTIAGVKNIFVRYFLTPQAPEAPAAVAAAPTVDSTRIKAMQDSIKAAQSAHMKQSQQKKKILTIAIIALIILIAALLFMIVPMIKQRMVMGKINKEGDL